MAILSAARSDCLSAARRTWRGVRFCSSVGISTQNPTGYSRRQLCLSIRISGCCGLVLPALNRPSGSSSEAPLKEFKPLGHSDIRMSSRYIHATDARLRGAVDGLTREPAKVLDFEERKAALA